MQTQTITNKTSVHIKAQHNDEFRRFSLSTLVFSSLESTVRTVFSIPSDTLFKVKYLDDEKDWVLFSSDSELQHAVDLSTSPLRLLVVLPEDTPAKKQEVKPVEPTSEPFCCRGKWRGRGGRGCRGGLGMGGMGRGPMISKEERLTMKTSRISGRISVLEATLLDPTLTSDRERAITWKLEQLKQKLERFETMKSSVGKVGQAEEKEAEPIHGQQSCSPCGLPCGLPCSEPQAPVPTSTDADADEHPWACGGGGRWRGKCGRGRGGWRRQEATGATTTEEEGDHSCGKRWVVPKETWAHFQECKEKLRVARSSGDAEAIKVALEEFMLAKEQKKAARFPKNF